MLNDTQKQRYLRHLMLKEVGKEGQEKLLKASVLIIGAGGLGSPNALYLAAAGIGKIGILDFDKVDISNLQRQIIHAQNDLEREKVLSAKAKMEAINDDVKVVTYNCEFRAENALDIIKDYDFVIDATDNFAAKFLINDACVLGDKPLAHAGIYEFQGNAMTIIPRRSACLSCAFDAPPPKELNPIFKAGLFGVLPGSLGTIQAAEAIKYILGVGELLTNTLLSVDLKNMNFRKISLSQNPSCPTCGSNGITELKDYAK